MGEEGAEAQDWQSRRCQPAEGDTTVRGLNIAGELEREGQAQVRCQQCVTVPSRPPLGGAGGTRGVGRRAAPEAESPRRTPRGSRRAKGRSKGPQGRHLPLPLARRGMNGGKCGELTYYGFTEPR